MEISDELEFSDWLAENVYVLYEKVSWDIDRASVKREVSLPNTGHVGILCKATKDDIANLLPHEEQ